MNPQTAAPSPSMVTVDVLVDGLVHDGIARKKGDTIEVSETALSSIGGRARMRIRPLMRSNQPNRLIGHRVCAPGETTFAPSLAIALEMHRSGAADLVNAVELGIPLPPRRGQELCAPGNVRLRATADLFIHGLPYPNVVAGREFEVDRERAENIVRQGVADPIGWTPRPVRKVLFKASRAGYLGSHAVRPGDVVVVTDEESVRYGLAGLGGPLGESVVPVRVRALKAQCHVGGGRDLDLGEVAEVPASIAEDLIAEGIAELTTDPISPGTSPGSRKSKSA